MNHFSRKCFVCGKEVPSDATKNGIVNLPVCDSCKDTPQEKKAVQTALESTADGLICGCIS